MPYALEDIDPPTDKEVADAKAIFGLTNTIKLAILKFSMAFDISYIFILYTNLLTLFLCSYIMYHFTTSPGRRNAKNKAAIQVIPVNP